jgi:PAS domain S-box-containing protein
MFTWLLEASSQPVMLYDLDTFAVRLVNRRCMELLGFTQDELKALPITDLLDPDSASHLRRLAASGELARLGEQKRIMNWRVGNDGVRLLELTSQPVNYLGSACRLVAFETPQAAASLPETEYRKLIEWLPVGVLIDVGGRIEYANFKAASLLGYESQSALSCMALSALFAHPSNQALQLKLAALRAGRSIDLGFVPAVLGTADGALLDVEAAVVPLHHCFPPKNQIVILDVTASRRMANALEKANEQLQRLSAELLVIQETERRNLARDLHDEVGQLLSAVKLHAQWLRNKAEPRDASLSEKFDLLMGLTDRALNEVRNLSATLRPPQLDELGLTAAVRWQIESVLGNPAVKITLLAQESAVRPAPQLELAAFRIVQECLTNVVRHADAPHALVELYTDDAALTVRITDDGRGFDVDAETPRHGVGLTGMRERVHAVGGLLSIESVTGRGTRVLAQLPLQG